MCDQAQELRRLVESARDVPRGAPRPAVVTVASGRGGDGTTTAAIHLAVRLHRQGRRTVLVEADPNGGHLALLCRLDEGPTLADVLAGRQTVADAVRPGPGGILVLPGTWGLEGPGEADPPHAHDWLSQFHDMTPAPDLVVLDAGSGHSRTLQRLWHETDAAVLVCMPAAASIMNAYALAKLLLGRGRSRVSLHGLINRVSGEPEAGQILARLADACRRFLSAAVDQGAWLPDDARLAFGLRAQAEVDSDDPALWAGLIPLADRLVEVLASRHVESAGPCSAQEPILEQDTEPAAPVTPVSGEDGNEPNRILEAPERLRERLQRTFDLSRLAPARTVEVTQAAATDSVRARGPQARGPAVPLECLFEEIQGVRLNFGPGSADM